MITYKKYFPHFDESFIFEVHRLLKNRVDSGFIFFTEQAKSEFQQLKLPQKFIFSGAVFPKVIFNSEVFETGAVLICFEFPVAMKSFSSNEFKKMTAKEVEDVFLDFKQISSLMVMSDSRHKDNTSPLSTLYDFLGPEIQIFGSHIENNDELKEIFFCHNQWTTDDFLLIAFESAKSRHESFGWLKDSGPFLITEKSENFIHKLDYQKASDVYFQAIHNKNNETHHESNSFQFNCHPLGIEHINGTMTICQINDCNQGSIEVSFDIRQNTFVYILKYDTRSFLQNTEKMVQRLLKERRLQQDYDLLVFYAEDRLTLTNNYSCNELSLLSVLGVNYGGICSGVFKNKLNGSFEMQPLSLQCNSLEVRPS